MSWRSVHEAPEDRLIVFAVAVFGRVDPLTSRRKFLRWDTWTDDPSGDWDEEREIGWRMADATCWTECPDFQPAAGRMSDG